MTPAIVRDIDAVPVAWREAGPDHGDPVIFLHGLGSSRTGWDPQLRALGARGYRCAAWDMPGYGASPAPGRPLTFALLADAVVEWIDVLGSASAHLVGLSLGGMIAQHVAIAHPERIQSLTLIDTSPAFGLDGTTTADDWIGQRIGPSGDGAAPASMAAAVLRAIMAPGTGDDVVGEATAAMSRVDADAFEAAVRCLVTHDTRMELHRIVAPTLVMVGEHDIETPLRYAARLAASIVGARLEIIPGAGHISNLENPDRVNDLLVDFLES